MKLASLETFSNEVEAIMLAQILESEGIQAVVRPLGGGYGALGVTQWIHHGVFVSENDLKRAAEIMESIESDAAGEDMEIAQP